MYKKAIGLVALVGAVGVMAVAGCSSAEVTQPTADAAPTSTTPATDASTDRSVPNTDSGTCEENITGKSADVIKSIDAPSPAGYGPYKSTLPSAGQCTTQNIADFKAYLAAAPADATYEQIIAKLNQINPTCATCTFKATDGANWGPFVTEKDSSGATVAFSNVAGCYESLGVSKACATAIHYFDKCSSISCSACASDDDYDQCEADTYDTGGQCATEFGPGIADACGKDPKFDAAGAICENENLPVLVNVMTGACGAAATDAGGGG